MLTSDLGGPHDAALAFSILHHLQPDQRTRCCAACAPRSPPARRSPSSTHVPPDFDPPRRTDVRSIPDYRLYVASAR
jgi:hypothetical protein